MDIKRPAKSKLKKRIRAGVLIFVGLAAVAGITHGLSKMKPAAPILDRSTAVIGTVKRGEMVREVSGNGTLVPQVTRWIPAPADGRVEKILVQVVCACCSICGFDSSTITVPAATSSNNSWAWLVPSSPSRA